MCACGAGKVRRRRAPDPEAFVEALDPLQPRPLLDLGRSPKGQQRSGFRSPSTAVRYDIGKRKRLWRRLDVPRRPRQPRRQAPRLCAEGALPSALPADPNVPVIMIGPGTGVAPFRAFLHERMATKAPGRKLAVSFGHQKRDFDFFYEDELNGMKDTGVLTAAVARPGSRDGEEKILRPGPHAPGRARSLGRGSPTGRAHLCLRATRSGWRRTSRRRALIDIRGGAWAARNHQRSHSLRRPN